MGHQLFLPGAGAAEGRPDGWGVPLPASGPFHSKAGQPNLLGMAPAAVKIILGTDGEAGKDGASSGPASSPGEGVA